MGHQEPKHRRVLLIEDDSAVKRMLNLSLRCGGFETTQAESGGEALRKLDADAFDAVILDLCLPDGLGGDVLHRLQTTDRRPVWVAMSALDESEAHERFGPLQGPFIAKPFNPWDLIGLLDHLLSDDLEDRRDVRERRAAC
jgi:two-component system KDP operon response regulator KdpE